VPTRSSCSIAKAQGDVAPIPGDQGRSHTALGADGVVFDVANDEVWAANFANHTATVFARDAKGDVAPKRVVRSAPQSEPAATISNPYSIAYNPGRQEIIVPSCVANPQISMFALNADKAAAPAHKVYGQNSKLNRTVHGVSFDEIHNEIFVSSQIGQAVLTFKDDASGNVPPIRILQGPKRRSRSPNGRGGPCPQRAVRAGSRSGAGVQPY
jgi:hypothetical protein